MTKVKFFTNRYAPGMVQAQILDAELLAKVKGVVTTNGGVDEDTALLSWEDIKDMEGNLYPPFSEDDYDELSRGWDVVLEMDSWEAAALYGYNSADDLMERGEL